MTGRHAIIQHHCPVDTWRPRIVKEQFAAPRRERLDRIGKSAIHAEARVIDFFSVVRGIELTLAPSRCDSLIYISRGGAGVKWKCSSPFGFDSSGSAVPLDVRSPTTVVFGNPP